ncbi:MAG: hypothetical protein ACRD0G_01180 [Acidimicrobiales bacterium]
MPNVVAVSSGQALMIAIPVLVLLAGLLVVGAASRMDRDRAVGQLSRETWRADRGPPRHAVETPTSGREIERGAKLQRSTPAAAVTTVDRGPLARYVPPDAEALG